MEQEFQSPNPTSLDQTLNLRHYWHVILERRWLVITAFISVVVLSIIYLFKATPIYQATTRLQIDRETDTVLTTGGFSIETREPDYLQTQYKNLLSRTLLQKVISELNLEKDPVFADASDRAEALSKYVSVVPIRLSRLVDVKVEHPDPKMATRIANTLVSNFISFNLDIKMGKTLDIVKRLKAEAYKQEEDVEKAEAALDKYRQDNKIISFENSENIIFMTLKNYQSSLDMVRTEAAAAQKVVEEVDAILKSGKPTNSIPLVANSIEIQQMLNQLAGLEASFAGLQKRYGPKHPKYIAAYEPIQNLKAAINRQAALLIEAARNDARIKKTKEQSLATLVKEQELKQESLQSKRIAYEVLKRKAESQAVLWNNVLASMKEKELTGRHVVNNMRIVDPASFPTNPVKPRKILTLFLGVFGGLAVALGLAFFVNYLDDSIKSQDDVETYLRLPFLGYIPNIKTNSVVERDLQSHSHPQSNAAEGFRTIRATISLTHKPDKFRVLTITSTIPSEGKSLVASNLAIVTAQTGLRTLLVDADLRRPSVHKAYQLHSPVGLSSFLLSETDDLEKLVHKTEVPNLDVVCCGAVPSTPSELIGSKRMMEFLERVRGKYDRVLLDCPPVSAVSDPLVISAMSDGVVYVTKFNKIRREHARKSIQRIQNAGIHIMGVVLNDIDFEGKDSYYYSYYYYQNRYYSSHYRSAGAERKDGKKAESGKPRNGD
ncbi:MAG: polysaccharide biosynthesis tyrosine autokinase [Verrucomicrobiota bacterium]